MAFSASGLRLVSNGNPQVFVYSTNDLLSAVDDSGYFDDAYDKFKLGDIILVSGDQDGTPANVQMTVNSATGATTVTTVVQASATISFQERIATAISVPAIGTAETIYWVCPIAGSVSYVGGVSHSNGAGSGGTSTITVSVPTTGAIATLAFAQDYVAGTAVEDSTITAHTALAAGGVVTIATDGTGSHTDAAIVTLKITPS